jgi:indole-3-glycerol phosphate synthase
MLRAIIAQKRNVLEYINRGAAVARMKEQLSLLPPVRSLRQSLKMDEGIALIAEIKRRSPHKGVLVDNLSAAETAFLYEDSGARGISVLTETEFFNGSIYDLQTAKRNTLVPVLRKDFIVDPYQVWESRLIGADAILLIAAILSSAELQDLHRLAREIGLEVLVEIHDEQELNDVLAVGPEMIGINNRNLKNFKIDHGATARLAPMIPGGILKVSESGIKDRNDVLRAEDVGMDAVLVGEAIVKAADRGQKIRELLGTINDQD